MPDTAVTHRKLARCFIAGVALAQTMLLASWAFPLQAKNNNSPKPQKNSEGKHFIDRLEDKWREGVLKSDPAILDSLMADDYVAIQASGTLLTKDETLSAVRAGQWKIRSLDISERKVRFYGRTAVVTSLAQVEGTTGEGNVSGTYRYTRVYAKDARGNWRIVNFEASRIGHRHPPGPGPGSAN